MNETERQILELIGQGESLTLEFKSDLKSLPDRELIAAVVALANTEGGELLLGVEDNGDITGLHSNHKNLASLPALIANKTNPAIAVRVERCEIQGYYIGRITVPKSRQLVSTSDGLLQRRRLKLDGTPEAVPFYPHEFIQRQSAMGLTDPSAMPVIDVAVEELDPLQRLRIRNAIKKYGGDQSLLPLADNELDGALGLVVNDSGRRIPTVAGLLLLGSEIQLRRHLPAHEVAFQVLRGTDVQVNEFFRKPLLETFEELELLFRARVSEEEIQVGLFRVPIPNFDRRAFREAFVNALVHRDYSRLGAVHVKLDDEGLAISSPGGFVEGVTLDNLLVVDPRSRNPLLADIIKRIGLAERTGRGIDRIFEGMLRYGRPAPDYTLSSPYTVSVRMAASDADLDFLKMVITQEDQRGDMPIDSLIILSRLRNERRLTTARFAGIIQKPEPIVRATIEKLVEAGLVEAHGSGRGRSYTLSVKFYRHTDQKAAYVRQVGFDSIQQEQMVLSYIDKHGSIKRADVMDLCHLTRDQAYKLLARLKKHNEIDQIGDRKGAIYERKR
ncbi:RNA-binding domain-containing protein [Methylicorpusculum sp.]|uniref:RNA-binding domain-containing protein n=1 Tax=Methylicorpusculum sp. TaxID=2713644 RepID=UPI002720F3B0|nr:RNA-binding domain-containing protein [Methylicorpusculum sp.]MDO8843848.1 putative DNA binding domain-containing protein [Methylicorpusculum sp.]